MPAPKPLKPLKPLKLCKSVSKRLGTPSRASPKPHQCATPNRAGKSYPKARSIASSGRSSLPFARRSHPTGTPRLQQWLLIGVQAYLSIQLSICLSNCLSIYLSISLSISLPIYPSIHPSLHPSIHPSINLSLSLSLQDPPNRGGRRHPGASPFISTILVDIHQL